MDGLVELHRCTGLPNNTSEAVSPQEWPALLREQGSWAAPEEDESSVWFVTTDKGFELYRTEHGWG
jgi:hypothetical protein